jgi:hypothetical protein
MPFAGLFHFGSRGRFVHPWYSLTYFSISRLLLCDSTAIRLSQPDLGALSMGCPEAGRFGEPLEFGGKREQSP